MTVPPPQRLAPDSPTRKQKQPEKQKTRPGRAVGAQDGGLGAKQNQCTRGTKTTTRATTKKQQQKTHTGAPKNRVQNRRVQGAGQGADRTEVPTVPGADRAEGHGGDVDPGQGAGPGADNPGARTVQGAGREDGSGADAGTDGSGADAGTVQGAGPGADNTGARTVQGAGREGGNGGNSGDGGPGAAHDGDVAWPVAWKVASQLQTPTG
ncbi:gamma-aminobutyric acid type B receptor [Sarotherodon galilaeus]